MKTILHNSNAARPELYVNGVIKPALSQVTIAFQAEGVVAKLEEEENRLTLKILCDDEDLPDFTYGVRLKYYARTETESEEIVADPDDTEGHLRAEVYLKEGGQDYDIMGWTTEQIIHDVLDQYEKHLAFLRQVNRPAEV